MVNKARVSIEIIYAVGRGSVWQFGTRAERVVANDRKKNGCLNLVCCYYEALMFCR